MKQIIRNKYLIFIISALILTQIAAVSPVAAKKKNKAKSSQSFLKKIKFEASLGLAYDDNIINYSDDDLALYDNRTRPDKFAIESRDDFIFSPGIESRYVGRLLGGKNGSISAGFNYYFFAQNDVKRYARISLNFRQYIIRSGYVQFTYGLIPSYYYRNQYYSPDTTYKEAKFLKHSLGLEIGYDIIEILKADLSYNFQIKDFNMEFNERDTDIHAFEINFILNARHDLKFWSGYRFEIARSDGKDISDPDIIDASYDSWSIPLGIRYLSRFQRSLKPEFYSRLQFRQTKYQSSKIADLYRFGRQDDNFQMEIGVTAAIYSRIKANLSYTFQKKISDLPTDSLESALDYSSNLVALRFERAF